MIILKKIILKKYCAEEKMPDVKDRIVFPLYETAKIDKSVATGVARCYRVE